MISLLRPLDRKGYSIVLIIYIATLNNGVLSSQLKKTRCVIFSKGHTNYDLKKNFIFGETIIQFESFYKYLGVEINDNSQFSLVQIERVKKARKAIGMIKKLLSATDNVSVKLAKNFLNPK